MKNLTLLFLLWISLLEGSSGYREFLDSFIAANCIESVAEWSGESLEREVDLLICKEFSKEAVASAKHILILGGEGTGGAYCFSDPSGDLAYYMRGTARRDRVCIAILARNKAHTLPHYLSCIEQLDYDKRLIDIYINTNNNVDQTRDILEAWTEAHRDDYASIVIEGREVDEELNTNPHVWGPKRFRVLAEIRNRSMQFAQEKGCDYYFVIDCDNFIAPCTLKELLAKRKPIIAPLLSSVPATFDPYSNFFCAVDGRGYYRADPNYFPIYLRRRVGTFQVPVVHCTYLIDVQEIKNLNYIDGTDDHEFVIFSRTARANGVGQYICNEREFGVLWHETTEQTLEQEAESFAFFFPKGVH